MTWVERKRFQGRYWKRRMRVDADERPPFQSLAARICAGCGQPVGFGRVFVQHYRYFHLPCWQAAFPALAAKDRETRGEE